MALTVQLTCSSGDLLGIHYVYALPTHIVITATDASSGPPAIACGATAWNVYDGADGSSVGSGTMSNTATTFNISTSGSWTGGSTILPGWYQVVTNNAGSSSAYVLICSSNPLGGSTNLVTAGSLPTTLFDVSFLGVDLAGWAPGTSNRDCYAIPDIIPSHFVSNIAANPYFTSVTGPNRPHDIWVAPGPQSSTSPSTTDWGAIASALVTAGHSGAVYELPTNEPENADGPGENVAAIITQINAAHTAVHAQDATARYAVFSSAGFEQGASPLDFSAWGTILAGLSFVPDFLSTHMEDDIQNMADFVSLRQYFDHLQAISAASNNQPWWFTETGMAEAAFGVLSTHRGPRQRVLFRMVVEQYGWLSEHCYDFPQNDHGASAGLLSYGVEGVPFGAPNGNIRPGWYALHVRGEALFSTSIPPAALNFGAVGTVGGSMFIGSHYTGVDWDAVELMTNGVIGASVILNVPGQTAGDTITVWNGWGRTSTVTVDSSKNITVPVDDLATYVFLAPSSTVSVVDTDQGVIGFNSATNKISGGAVTKNSSNVTITLPEDSFSSSYIDFAATTPFNDTTVPNAYTTTGVSGTVNGFALRTTQPTFFAGDLASQAPSAPTAFTVSMNGTLVYNYANATAVNHSGRPSGDSASAGDPATSTEYWNQQWCWVLGMVPTAITGSIVLDVTATSYGGTILNADPGGIVQSTTISEWQVFAGGSSPPTASGTASSGHMLLMMRR